MILGIDTVGDTAYIGLYSKERQIEKKWPCDRGLSEELLLNLDGLLKEARLGLRDLLGVFVITGPGSFTSIRSGVVMANILAWSLDKPIIGYKKSKSSLFQLALKAEQQLAKEKNFKGSTLPYYKYKAKITYSQKRKI